MKKIQTQIAKLRKDASDLERDFKAGKAEVDGEKMLRSEYLLYLDIIEQKIAYLEEKNK